MNAKTLDRAYRTSLQRIEESERLVRSLQDQVPARGPSKRAGIRRRRPVCRATIEHARSRFSEFRN